MWGGEDLAMMVFVDKHLRQSEPDFARLKAKARFGPLCAAVAGLPVGEFEIEKPAPRRPSRKAPRLRAKPITVEFCDIFIKRAKLSRPSAVGAPPNRCFNGNLRIDRTVQAARDAQQRQALVQRRLNIGFSAQIALSGAQRQDLLAAVRRNPGPGMGRAGPAERQSAKAYAS